MTLRVALHHETRYAYDRSVALGPQVIRLRPAPHCRTPIRSFSLHVAPDGHFLNWQQDPHGNFLARVVFPEPADHLHVSVDLVADMEVLNPFDFFLEESANDFPFEYEPWLAEELLPYLKAMPAGSAIITVTSNQGFSPAPYLLDYATTKFAIRGFTEALAQGAIEQGVRVNGIAPGPFWTPLQPSGGQTQDKVEEFGKGTPMGRPGQPAELAPAFVYLASSESSYVCGEIIGITGGKPIS